VAAKLTRLIQQYNCTQWQIAVPFAVLTPGGQSGNFWAHPRMSLELMPLTVQSYVLSEVAAFVVAE
jgi:hypothetical protein